MKCSRNEEKYGKFFSMAKYEPTKRLLSLDMQTTVGMVALRSCGMRLRAAYIGSKWDEINVLFPHFI